MTCLSVCPSPGHGVVGFHSDLPVRLPFGLWHCDTTEFPPSVSKREPSLLGSGWDSFPGIPDSRGSQDRSLGFIPSGDSRLPWIWIHSLGSRLPLDHRLPWIPDYRLGFPGIPWDSGFENSKSSQVVATMYRRIPWNCYLPSVSTRFRQPKFKTQD